jgi:protein TonB
MIAAVLLPATFAQQSGSPSPDAPAEPSKMKSKVTAPKAIDTPNPEPVSDPGKGPTVFWVVIGADGLVHDIKMTKSSDSEKADANALAAVKQWRFKPAMKDGVPVAVPINIQVDARRH